MTAQYQQIIDDIQTALSAETDPTPQELAALDRRYVDAVREVNDRLRECDRLLRDGLRAEALQKSEIEPNLLDAVANLDFLEREQWADFVRQFGLPGPPELLTDVAADLNAAYAIEAPMAQLMRWHRLYALARAPLPKRIEVMRRIAAADPTNPVWETDIRTCEKVRHTSLQEELEAATRQADVRTLAQLEAEVASNLWLEKPPGTIVERVISAHTAVRVKTARLELDKLAHQLADAHSEFDIERARRLRTRWNARAAIGVNGDDDPLCELAAPALDWIAEVEEEERQEAEFQSVLSQLERALEDYAPRQELERLYHAAIRLERELPSMLEQRLAERWRNLDTVTSRRHRVLLTGVVLLLTITAGLVFYGVYEFQQHQRRTAFIGQLAALVDAGNREGARTFVEGLRNDEPEICELPEIQKLITDLEAMERKEAERQTGFSGHMRVAREVGLENAQFTTFRDADRALEEADGLAASDAERTQVVELRSQVRARRLDMQNAVDNAFGQSKDALLERLDGLPTLIENLPPLQRLQEDIKLLGLAPHVSPEMRQQLPPLTARVEAKIAAIQKEQGRERLLQKLTQTVGEPAAYAQALKTYIDVEPGTARSADFQRVLDQELLHLEAVAAWNQTKLKWNGADLSRESPLEIQARLAEVQAVSTRYPGFESAAVIQALLPQLQRIVARVDASKNGIEQKLVAILSQPSIRDLNMLISVNGAEKLRYYFRNAPPEPAAAQSLSIDAFANPGFAITRTVKVPKTRAHAATSAMQQAGDWKSPQSVFANHVIQELDRGKFKAAEWDFVFYRLLARLDSGGAENGAGSAESEMDPVIKFSLYKRLLQTACEGSLFFQQEMGKELEMLELAENGGSDGSIQVDTTANWVDPEKDDAAEARKNAERLLGRLPRLSDSNSPRTKALQQSLMDYLKKLKNVNLGPRYEWVGWLYRDPDQQWRCRLGTSKSAPSGRLVVLISEDTKRTFEPVGRTDGVTPVIDVVGGEQLLREGRPVFVELESKSS